jgi:hypothetical protein
MGTILARSLGLAVAGLASFCAGCSSSITSSQSSSQTDFNQPVNAAPEVYIYKTGVTPQVSHPAAGVPIRFINEDTVAHLLTAAPELGYGDCPEMANLGTLAAGATGSVTITRSGVLCAFHDQADPGNRPFQGLLVLH